MTEPMSITLDAYQVIEKIVKAGGNSGRVYVPKEWVDKRVKIILMEPVEVQD
jgi:putative transposon-encoded protein